MVVLTLVASSLFMEVVPIVGLEDRADVEHRLGSLERPAHPGAFHPILDQLPAHPFDDARGDWIPRRETRDSSREIPATLIFWLLRRIRGWFFQCSRGTSPPDPLGFCA